MRKITEDAYNAFMNNRIFKLSNMHVFVNDGITKMYLFQNLIAKKVNGQIYITSANYPTRTTVERLSCFVSIKRIKGQLVIFNSEKQKIKWDGSWLNIKDYERKI